MGSPSGGRGPPKERERNSSGRSGSRKKGKEEMGRGGGERAGRGGGKVEQREQWNIR